MASTFDIGFAKTARASGGLAILLQAAGQPAAGLGEVDPEGVVARAAGVAKFTGKALKSLDIIAPHGAPVDRIRVLGLGEADKLVAHDWLKAGGAAAAKTGGAEKVAIYIDAPGATVTAKNAADFALGMQLGAYSFDAYKTKKGEDEETKPNRTVKVTIVTASAAAAKKANDVSDAIAEGVILARNLVNEPANVLGPVEFAEKAKALEKLGVEVDILTEREMKRLGMAALLGVAQGSVRPPRLAVMQWKGGKDKDRPIAFIGKGVIFDTGGISIKPAGGMEEMKWDMGGAGTVAGLMVALAGRKAKVDAVGILGLVENMPSGTAQRPGDVVTSYSGQTIEVLNTDAEGRLVLADALWYCQEKFAPRFMVDLATLTGAIIVALGHEHAGLFSNNDELSQQLTAAGIETGEKVWRMPLGDAYDKMLKSDIADMKNIGGRPGGSITAAQFIQRFVNDTPWAHLDIAGTAWTHKDGAIIPKGASAFGVRLLDRLVANHFEE